MMRSRRRRLLALACGAALLAFWFLVRRPPDSRPAPRPVPSQALSPTVRAPQSQVRAAARPAVGSQMAAVVGEARAPIIDEVRIEKAEVCEGEENLVTVKAHTPENADDAFLHYMIGGKTGGSVAVRGTREMATSGALKAIAFGRNGVSTTVDVPPFLVKDCKVDYQLLLSLRMLPNRVSGFELGARIDPAGASAPFRPVRYTWTFGDGTTVQTLVPVATHDYSRRPQRTMASTFVIGCVAVSRTGEKVEGRTTLELNNLGFESFAYKGVVKIFAENDPLFPVLAPDGVVTQRVRLWHAYDGQIRIDRLKRTKLVLGARAARVEEVPATVLGVDRIMPGETTESRPLTLDTHMDPDVYSVEYTVEGTTEDGWPARGNFALMRPPPAPTRENSTPVVDPVLKAKILRTREILGKKLVTDEDIWRLEREGRLSDIRVDPQAAPAAPAQPRPRPPVPGSRM